MTYAKTQSDKKPGEVFVVGLIRKAVAAGHDEAITAAIAAIAEVPRLGQSVAAYSDFLLNPWIGAVAASPIRAPHVLAAALARRNPFKVIEDARASHLSGTPLERARKALLVLIFDAARTGVAA
jgi:hypothetical protein